MAQCLVSDYASAARNQRAAHEVYRELGNRLGQANALTALAEARRLTGDQAGAARDLEEAIGIFLDLGFRGSEAWALNYRPSPCRASVKPTYARGNPKTAPPTCVRP